MHAPRYWKLRKGVCCAAGTSSKSPCFHHRNGAVNFLCALGMYVPNWSNCQQLKEVTHRMEKGRLLLKISVPLSLLLAFLLIPLCAFSQMHLEGQNL
jgi:hypothetical protein